ncbi:hypothetical protein CKF54_07180 [Psittacicella hinzii]|uniref:Transposase IS4-like domain-containing protein n=1 Tax=Psittacicella hinzii TaxID=2028575 RepID=A0A3A1Y185_9GAMM|nr:transposase [Psittacicella hinzii]RIY31221.1 hypothetical protein CKF54_07180 [Psittacicella hinzii]
MTIRKIDVFDFNDFSTDEKRFHILSRKDDYFSVSCHVNSDGTPRRKRKYVIFGKLVNPEKSKTLFYPNSNFFEYFPEAKDQSKEIPYRNKKTDDKKSTPLSLLICAHTSDKIGRTEDLQKARPNHWKKDLGIALFRLLTDGKLEKSNTFFKHANIPGLKLSASSISQYYKNIDSNQIQHFKELVAKRYGRSQYVSLDSTSLNTEAKNIVYSARGINKDMKDVPQVNNLVMVDHGTGMPFYWMNFWGNMTDVTVLKNLLNQFPDIKQCHFAISMDRGFYSEDNIKYMSSQGIKFTTALPKNNNIFKQALRASKLNGNSSNPCRELPGNAIEDIEFEAYDKDKVKLRFIVLLNHAARGQQIDTLFKRKALFENMLDKYVLDDQSLNKGKKVRLKWFHIKRKGESELTYEFDQKKFDADFELCGFSVFITNDFETPAHEIVKQYRNKDKCEKFHTNVKTYLNYRNLRLHSTDSLEGTSMCVFNGASIRSYMQNARSTYAKENPDVKMNKSLPTLMYEMEHIKVTRLSDDTFYVPELPKDIRIFVEEVLGFDKEFLKNTVPELYKRY